MNEEQYLKNLIEELREQYDELYHTAIGEYDFIWRALGRKEYNHIAQTAVDEMEAFERICQRAVLWPEGLDFSGRSMKAYIPSELAPQILEISGFTDVRGDLELLQIFRNEMNGFDKQAEVLITSAFPYITIDEIETWTKERLMKYLAKAEWQLKTIRRLDIELISKQDLEKQQEEQVEQEEPDLHKTAMELRKQGIDPMFALRHLYQTNKPDFVERPFIGGSKQTDSFIGGVDCWKEGGMIYGRNEYVRKQVQKISRR